MNESWPTPKDGYKKAIHIGNPLTDDEIREMGYEPTRQGWVPVPVWLSRMRAEE